MKRRALLGLFVGLPAATAIAYAQPRFEPTPQDRTDMARITAYLDGLRTMKAHFLQVAPSGAITQGTVWLDRPGRMRFQYDPPAPFVLMASHGQLIFHDESLGQTSNISLSRTPLGIRTKCVELGISLRDPRKHIWHRLRILFDPTIHKALTLAARKRGMRCGELCRRILTAVAVHDLIDVTLAGICAVGRGD